MRSHLQCGCGPGRAPCGCCAGIEGLTPLLLANRPGINSLSYRVGTHATFFESMLARLSTMEIEHDGQKLRPLAGLTTRELQDPAIALLDAWATVADVLTFYQERIANEAYLRTATERRSIIELARLVGYLLRPGVAASVWLALTLEDNAKVEIEPYAVRAQSVPGPGELPASFENIEKFEARGRWNKLGPRLTRPQNLLTLSNRAAEPDGATVYFKGINTGLNSGDPLLISANPSPALFRVVEVTTEPTADRTRVVVKPWIVTTASNITNGVTLRARLEAFENPGAAAPALRALSAEIDADRSEAELADFIENETLRHLERVAARRNISNAFRDRVHTLSEDLGGAVLSLHTTAARASATLRHRSMAARMGLGATVRGMKTQDPFKVLVAGLTRPASEPPRNSLRLGRDANTVFAAESDVGIQTIGVLQPSLLESLPVAIANTPNAHRTPPAIYAFRVKAPLFGHNAPLRSQIKETQNHDADNSKTTTVSFSEWSAADVVKAEEFFKPEPPADESTRLTNVVNLDGNYEKILPDSWVVVDTSAIDTSKTEELKPIGANPPLLIGRAAKVAANISKGAYGLSGTTTRIELGISTNKFVGTHSQATVNIIPDDFQLIRRTVVYAQAEKLELAEEPIGDGICAMEANEGWIDLDGVYSELKSGRWVIVEGERTDVLDGSLREVTGVKGTELAMIAEVAHTFATGIPGDTAHTRIKFSPNLEYCYARDKVSIYGNVVKSTHGETRKEILGSGDSSRSLQQFALKQPALTYVSAPSVSGVESTLKIFVNDVEWHEAPSIIDLQSTSRRFVTKRDDAEVTSAIFGNGKRGARLPTGSENVRAEYRQGIGKIGNVAPGKISMLAARPLSVKEVINPQRATGGADSESRDQARKNAPLAVMALDRLVSTRDYADFARTFGGVGKAFSLRLSDGIREVVFVTIVGASDIPIDNNSDLLRNLRLALTDFGDPAVPVRVAVRELLLLVISARVRLQPDYVWEKVAPKIRSKLLDSFGFEARDLGQDVFLSEVISAMQSVPGLAYVDVDALGGIAERNDDGTLRTPNELTEAARLVVSKTPPAPRVRVKIPELPQAIAGDIRPAQLAYLVPEVPDTLILNLID